MLLLLFFLLVMVLVQVLLLIPPLLFLNASLGRTICHPSPFPILRCRCYCISETFFIKNKWCVLQR